MPQVIAALYLRQVLIQLYGVARPRTRTAQSQLMYTHCCHVYGTLHAIDSRFAGLNKIANPTLHRLYVTSITTNLTSVCLPLPPLPLFQKTMIHIQKDLICAVFVSFAFFQSGCRRIANTCSSDNSSWFHPHCLQYLVTNFARAPMIFACSGLFVYISMLPPCKYC